MYEIKGIKNTAATCKRSAKKQKFQNQSQLFQKLPPKKDMHQKN